MVGGTGLEPVTSAMLCKRFVIVSSHHNLITSYHFRGEICQYSLLLNAEILTSTPVLYTRVLLALFYYSPDISLRSG